MELSDAFLFLCVRVLVVLCSCSWLFLLFQELVVRGLRLDDCDRVLQGVSPASILTERVACKGWLNISNFDVCSW